MNLTPLTHPIVSQQGTSSSANAGKGEVAAQYHQTSSQLTSPPANLPSLSTAKKAKLEYDAIAPQQLKALAQYQTTQHFAERDALTQLLGVDIYV
ncbi:hypothetical protein [Paraferrimonas sedimenticola]|uniref:Uncharacterized protein n=1 Tax=Paraferrimonas sedimenticola TaxID=375674 RepID=A0AA37RWY2_9GAMM|nr:hypothetical protein [Paraferrimonas sedimenticola]GLP96509.1 hypothetical protein GCM10007895_18150 [Paraferrimonas sedimenticola]